MQMSDQVMIIAYVDLQIIFTNLEIRLEFNLLLRDRHLSLAIDL